MAWINTRFVVRSPARTPTASLVCSWRMQLVNMCVAAGRVHEISVQALCCLCHLPQGFCSVTNGRQKDPAGLDTQAPFTRYNVLSLSNRFDNRLYHVNGVSGSPIKRPAKLVWWHYITRRTLVLWIFEWMFWYLCYTVNMPLTWSIYSIHGRGGNESVLPDP